MCFHNSAVMTGMVNRASLSKRATVKAKNREQYLQSIQKTLWQGRDMPKLPMTAVAAGLHLSEAIEASCRGRISPCSLVLALLYLERLKTGGEMATEYLCDVTPSELFIVSMKWKVYVGEKEFWQRIIGLYRTVSMREGSRRGWFTYEEMCALINRQNMTSIASTIVQVSAICLVSYTAAVLNMFGAAITSSHLEQYLQGASPLTTNQTQPSLLHDTTAMNPCPLDSWNSSHLPSTPLLDNVSFPLSVFYNDSHGDLEASASQELIYNPWQIVAFLTTVSSHDQLIREVRHEVALLQLKEFI
ncbi:hypothetical protein B566_EDAN000977 [Ephemera danica]|nr:hypothetical protein B566_EDAN000977 [Ephemera danica]